jgi:hypothetical protein
MKRLGAVVGLLVLAAGLSACLPPPPPPPAPAAALPTGKPTPRPSATPKQGFDACAAPSLSTMNTWWQQSPYTSVGVYLGGSNRACAQPNLTANWVTTTTTAGWRLIPIWVGPQSTCFPYSASTRMPTSAGNTAFLAGADEANKAVDAAWNLGIRPQAGWTAPIYYDIEAYTRTSLCVQVVKDFSNGWIQQLHSRGYQGGVYSSLCSAIVDLSASFGGSGVVAQDSIWFAAWPYNNDSPSYATYTPNLFGLSSCGSGLTLPDAQWANHQRLRQFRGGHNETWGGVTINIDTNAVDGMVYPGP